MGISYYDMLFDRRVLGMTPAFLLATFVVGIASGIVGSLYLLAIHLLQHVLWPDHYSSAAAFLTLALAGIVVVVLTRTLGKPGDVELLVDNIHVSGGMEGVRELRSLIPMSVVTISAG